MKRKILNMTALAVIAALFCVTCNDSGTDAQSEKWAGDVNRLLGIIGGTPNVSTATHTVTFNANGGTVSPTTGVTGTDSTLSSLPTPTRIGWNFEGWYTTAAANGGTMVDTLYKFSASVIIYARWTEIPASSFTITFNAGSGTVSPTSAPTKADSTLSIALPVPTWSGYNFDGWKDINDNAVTSSTVFTKDETIYARWTAVGGNDLYESVLINGKKWMSKNLNIAMEGSWCYENKVNNCENYGRLYTWDAARTACPAGWKLPSRKEWGDLAIFAGGTGAYGDGGEGGKNLKSTSGWGCGDNGTNIVRFSALPSGDMVEGEFRYAGYGSSWWTATEEYSGSSNAYLRSMGCNYDCVYENLDNKNNAYSVRCVQDY